MMVVKKNGSQSQLLGNGRKREIMRIKGTWKKKELSPEVYSLIMPNVTSMETLTLAITEMLKSKSRILEVGRKTYLVDKITILKTVVKVEIENVIIKWESFPQNTTSALELEMARFAKLKNKDYYKMKKLPITYAKNLSRGGRENRQNCGQRLVIEIVKNWDNENEELEG